MTLNGGRYGKEGHVAIRLPGEKKWGVICGDQWTYFEGSVVCRQLGLGMVKQVYQVSYLLIPILNHFFYFHLLSQKSLISVKN